MGSLFLLLAENADDAYLPAKSDVLRAVETCLWDERMRAAFKDGGIDMLIEAVSDATQKVRGMLSPPSSSSRSSDAKPSADEGEKRGEGVEKKAESKEDEGQREARADMEEEMEDMENKMEDTEREQELFPSGGTCGESGGKKGTQGIQGGKAGPAVGEARESGLGLMEREIRRLRFKKERRREDLLEPFDTFLVRSMNVLSTLCQSDSSFQDEIRGVGGVEIVIDVR